MTGDHTVNLVTSHDQVCILKTVLYFTHRHFTDCSVFYRPAFYRLVCKIVNLWDIDLKFYSQFLMLISTIVQNFVELPHVEGTFLKTSYLSVLGLCKLIIYRPVCKMFNLWDIDLKFYSQFLMLILTILQNFVKLSYLEVTFLETSYLSVFGLCRPIIYRPDE